MIDFKLIKRGAIFEVAQTVFLVNHVFVPCQKGAVLTKTAKMTNLHSIYPLKTRASLLRPPKTDENDENGGCHPSKGMV